MYIHVVEIAEIARFIEYPTFLRSGMTPVSLFQGLLTTAQLWKYFKDLSDPDFETHLAIVHSRFSTNTFPSWERAHPQR